MSDTYIHPSSEQLAVIRNMDLQDPIVMLNLLRFNPDGGAATFIGGEAWDEILLVEYPSKQAFLDMSAHPDYPAKIRAKALTDSHLYCTQPHA